MQNRNDITAEPAAHAGSESVDFIAIASLLWARRYWILAGTLAAACLGVYVALTTRPVYVSEAIVTPNEPQGSPGQSILGNLGGLGGMVAQLGAGRNNLIHLELLASSRTLAEMVVERQGYLERISKLKDPEWKPTGDSVADLKNAAYYLRDQCMAVDINQAKKTLRLSASLPEPVLAAELVRNYLATLREKIQQDARSEADSNRVYLQGQMDKTPDPLLREKILGMMSLELEKAMLVGSQPFQIIEEAEVPDKPEKPKKKLIVFLFALSGLGVSMVSVIFLRAVAKAMARARGGVPA